MNLHIKELLKHLAYYLVFLLVTSLVVIEYQNYSANKQAEIAEKIRIEKIKQKDKECIKAALWHEARNQSVHGIEAVASVIINRVNSNNYASDFCSVIYQPKQFSFSNKITSTNLSIKNGEHKKLEIIEDISSKIIEGSFKNKLPSSVLFYAKTNVKNYWTIKKKRYATIGDHIFYYG